MNSPPKKPKPPDASDRAKKGERLDSSQSIPIGGELWPVPMALTDPPPAALRADLMPDPVSAWATGLARGVEVDPSMTVLAADAAISLALVRTRVRVVLKAEDGGESWTQPLNTYAVPVAEPSERKSPVYEAAIKPILAYEVALQEPHQREHALAEEGIKSAESRCGELRRRLSKLDDLEERKKVGEDLRAATGLLADARRQVPKLPELLISDVHPNTLAKHLDDVGGTCGVFTDEGEGPFSLLSSKDKGDESAHFGVWLPGYDGSWSRTKRKEFKFAGAPHVSALVFCQSRVLQDLGRGGSAHGLGFTSRWSYGVCESWAGRRTNRAPALSSLVSDRYSDMLGRLLALPGPSTSARLLYLDEGAEQLFLEYRDELEMLQSPTHPLGSIQAMKQWLGKHAARVGRLAARLHVAAQAFDKDPLAGRVSEATMKDAITLGRSGVEHATAAFGLMARSEVTARGLELLRWLHGHPDKIQNHGTAAATVTVRDLLGHMRRHFKDGREDLDPVLKRLVDLDWLRLVDPDARLEKTSTFLVNPAVWQRADLFNPSQDRGGRAGAADFADTQPTQVSADKTGATPSQPPVNGAFANSADVSTPNRGVGGVDGPRGGAS